jgi:predicted transcriptional regulator
MRVLDFSKFILNEEEVVKPTEDKKENKVLFTYKGKEFDFTNLYKKLGLV